MSTVNAPTGRIDHTAVWTGTEMVLWGGYNGSYLNSGGKYNLSTDTWISTSTSGAPTFRRSPTSIWTGSKMIVWGGLNGTMHLNTGGIYTPTP